MVLFFIFALETINVLLVPGVDGIPGVLTRATIGGVQYWKAARMYGEYFSIYHLGLFSFFDVKRVPSNQAMLRSKSKKVRPSSPTYPVRRMLAF